LIWRRGLFWQLLLLGANVLLLVGIIHVWWGEEVMPALSRPGEGPEVPKTPILRDQQALSAFGVVASKNLFSQDRTGPDPGEPTAKGQASLEGRRLLGTIIIGEERAAIVSQSPARGKREPEILVVRLGEQWEGFKVVEISSEALVLLGKDGKKTLNFPD
jgi:hypothetical protein